MVLDTVDDLVGKLLYYDRKGDDVLPVGAIEELVQNRDLTYLEIVSAFAVPLAKALGIPNVEMMVSRSGAPFVPRR